MLVLTRQQRQAIHIGDNIKLVVLRIGREKVRIGIDAPPWMPIRLGEETRWPDVAGQSDGGQAASDGQTAGE